MDAGPQSSVPLSGKFFGIFGIFGERFDSIERRRFLRAQKPGFLKRGCLSLAF
jgi:hypothetical protein